MSRGIIIKDTHRGLYYEDGVLKKVLGAGREDILRDVKESASSYGITILRADVKDLAFPGNLQEVMNRVLAAERMSEAQLVEARTKAETFRIAAAAQTESDRTAVEAQSAKIKLLAESQAEALRLQAGAEALAAQERAKAAAVYTANPALLRLRELETLQALAQNANARLYIDFNKPSRHEEQSEE